MTSNLSKILRWIIPLVAGLIMSYYLYWQNGYYTIKSFIFEFIIGALLAAVSFFIINRYTSKLPVLFSIKWIYSFFLGLFLDLYFSFLTFDIFCPHSRSDYWEFLSDPCSGWPLFVDFHYATWPWFAIGNLLIWIVVSFVILILVKKKSAS